MALASVPPGTMAENKLDNLRRTQTHPSHALNLVQLLLDRPKRLFQLLLLQSSRKVAASTLGNPPHHVSDPPQVTGDGIWEVDRDQQAVDVIHSG